MGNIAFKNNGGLEASTETMRGHLVQSYKIDVVVAVVLSVVIGLTISSTSTASDILGCLIVVATLVNAYCVFSLTSTPPTAHAAPHARMCVVVNTVGLALTVARDLLTVHENPKVISKVVLLIIFSVLVFNKAVLLMLMLRFERALRSLGVVADGSMSGGLLDADLSSHNKV